MGMVPEVRDSERVVEHSHEVRDSEREVEHSHEVRDPGI